MATKEDAEDHGHVHDGNDGKASSKQAESKQVVPSAPVADAGDIEGQEPQGYKGISDSTIGKRLEHEEKNKSNCIRMIIVVILLAVVIVPSAIVLGSRQSKKEDASSIQSDSINTGNNTDGGGGKPSIELTPSAAPTSNMPTDSTPAPTTARLGFFADLIFKNNSAAIPKVGNSPQWRALQWLSQEDPALSDFTYEEGKVYDAGLLDRARTYAYQRYALATFYFATNGET